jgi:hypothetical protein
MITAEQLQTKLYDAAALIDQQRNLIDMQNDRIKKLEALLADCAEFLEPYSDVVDGSYGEPSPNAAMSLLSSINEEIT